MRYLILFFILFAFTTLKADGPVVHSVLFYSTNCPHCHDVIKKDLPPLLEEYEGQFEVALINVSTHDGEDLYEETIKTLNIPKDKQGVPTLVIGDTYLVGSIEIPEKLPDLIKKGLMAGGTGLPAIPGLGAKTEKTLRGKETFELPEAEKLTFAQRWQRDPIGNTLAIILLAIMVASLFMVVLSWIGNGFPVRPGTAWGGWLFPLLTIAGIVIAIYLGYIEVTGHKAVCGPIGRCNDVQQSPYATLFGFLPVGILGGVGYIAILALWLWQRFSPLEVAKKTSWILPLVVLLGLLVSIYFTFLEPFVIGAVCLWCLLSAAIMTSLMWLTYMKSSQ